MTKSANLRFLLSLGNQKIVVLDQQDNLHFYASTPSRGPNVSPARIAAALTAK